MKCRNEIRLRWRPYPEKKPKQARNCIVSISCNGTEYTTSSWWDSKEEQFSDYFDNVITAWAYMPRPYKKEKLWSNYQLEPDSTTTVCFVK